MNNYIQYLFEVTLGSSVLFLGFFLIKKFLSLQFRRFYLLGCLVLPLLFPLISFDNDQEIFTRVPSQVRQVFIEENFESSVELAKSDPIEIHQDSSSKDTETGTLINWMQVSLSFYLFVSISLFLRFAISIYSIYLLSKNPVGKDDGIKFFLISDQNFTGGSFFHFIFVNKRYLNDPSFRIILSHERSHLRLWHSLDIVFSELFCVFFWINPIAWLVKKEIRLNTEYEADQCTAKPFGKEHYANILLNLSVSTQNMEPMLSFSAIHTRHRLKKIQEDTKRPWFSSIAAIPFMVLACWLISCEPEMVDFAAMDPQAAMKNVKTVTTRYISHQKDTQQKDGNIIAVAYYLPDGTVDKVEQHMTYPYDFERPFERTFLANPDPAGVLHILDGFGIGEATNNILYGNDWPKYNKIDLFRAKSELYRKSTTIDKNEEGLPIKFTMTEELNEDLFYQGKKRAQKGSVISTLIEEFKYDDGKVLYHTKKHEKPESVIIYKNQKVNVGGPRLLHEMNYKYDDENLIEVSGRTLGYGSPTTTKMEYENGIMKSSSYYRNNTKYHYREFFYNSDGLKTRTEIFNVYGEPEYTILYDYEYY